ncbi:MAG: hypothetical protein QXS20_02705 [Candidatus Thorarchaeota archaeon]
MNSKLAMLGLEGLREGSGPLALLGEILRLTMSTAGTVTLKQIRLSVDHARAHPAAIQRHLRFLVRRGLVKAEDAASRRTYSSDVDIITCSLERMKSLALGQRMEQIEKLKQEVSAIEQIDPGLLAQQLVYSASGVVQNLKYHIVEGVEAMHRILLHNFASCAKTGDMIRLFVGSVRPLVTGIGERTVKFIEAARRGADIRYLVSTEMVRGDARVASQLAQQDIRSTVQEVYALKNAGVSFEWRLSSEIDGYNFVILNKDRALLMIPDDQLIAVLHTRESSADLIDDLVREFDRAWSSAIPMTQIGDREISMLGVGPGPFTRSISEAARENR